MHHRFLAGCLLSAVLALPLAARAQSSGTPPIPPAEPESNSTTIILPNTNPAPPGQPVTPQGPQPPKAQTVPPPGQQPADPNTLPASPFSPPPGNPTPPAQTQEPYGDTPIQAQPVDQPPVIAPTEPPPVEPPPPSGAMLDGHVREGAFLSSPGSLAFITHHTLLLGLGGMMTQVVAKDYNFNDGGARQAMLAGLLIGAGLGFGGSAWWQANHWLGWPVASYGIVNSVLGGMFMAGFMDLVSSDRTLLTWSTVLGAELAGWLTVIIGGGEMSNATGLLITSGAGWFATYTALMLAIVAFTGNGSNLKAGIDTLLMTPGIGAVVMSLASLKFHPTATQILRADLFGVGAGAAALLISVLFLGRFDTPTPYIMSMVASAGAIATVSLLWEEAAERPANALYRDPERHRPYRNVWW